jgi:hypothetical protein
VVHEGYGPGFRYRTPLFPPRGILVPIPYPGPCPAIFFANREAEKHPYRASASGCQGMQDGFGNSNMRATLLTHAAVRVGRLISAQGPTGAYLIRRTVPQDFALPKKRGSANHADDKPRASLVWAQGPTTIQGARLGSFRVHLREPIGRRCG